MVLFTSYLWIKTKKIETIIKIDNNSKAAKAFIAFVKTLPFVSVVDSNKVEDPKARYNAETEKAIDDARKGKTFKVKSSKELFEDLGIWVIT